MGKKRQAPMLLEEEIEVALGVFPDLVGEERAAVRESLKSALHLFYDLRTHAIEDRFHDLILAFQAITPDDACLVDDLWIESKSPNAGVPEAWAAKQMLAEEEPHVRWWIERIEHARQELVAGRNTAEERNSLLIRDLLDIFLAWKGVPTAAPYWTGLTEPLADFEVFLNRALGALPRRPAPPTLDSMRKDGLLQRVFEAWRQQLVNSIDRDEKRIEQTTASLPPHSRRLKRTLRKLQDSQAEKRSQAEQIHTRPRHRPKGG